MKAYLYPYKKGSKSAKFLAARMSELLGSKVFRIDETFKGSKYDFQVFNWGHGKLRFLKPVKMHTLYNANAGFAGNKLDAFKLFKENNVSIPRFTTDPDEAKGFITDKRPLVVRTILNGHSGAGIVLCIRPDDVPHAPLYVEYILKKEEYRVHVAFGEVIDVQQKRKRADYQEEPNYKVRNHHTGWVYCRDGIRVDDELRSQALAAIKALNLDYGAVDIIYNQKENKYYVLEVNTAPGLEGATVESYAQAFVKVVK